MVDDGSDITIGDPLVSHAVVVGKVLSHGRGKKVTIIKFRRRKHHRKQAEHRQNYTELEIVSVNGTIAAASGSSSQQQATVETESTSAAPLVPLKFVDAPNGEADDLKMILGIGPVLEEKLHEMGIYNYSQIAEFTDSDIENVNTHLSFPGRIERDEWITQAQNLIQGGEVRKLMRLPTITF
jgi:large subunit ribosomal protein L21